MVHDGALVTIQNGQIWNGAGVDAHTGGFYGKIVLKLILHYSMVFWHSEWCNLASEYGQKPQIWSAHHARSQMCICGLLWCIFIILKCKHRFYTAELHSGTQNDGIWLPNTAGRDRAVHALQIRHLQIPRTSRARDSISKITKSKNRQNLEIREDPHIHFD